MGWGALTGSANGGGRRFEPTSSGDTRVVYEYFQESCRGKKIEGERPIWTPFGPPLDPLCTPSGRGGMPA
eukprot:1187848-Prorocentrum_minimum.AAC.3